MGNWKNYDELEENISIDELIATLNAYKKQQHEEHRFFAAIQGIDLDKESARPANITEMTPYETSQAGFGVGMGIGHAIQQVSNSQSEEVS